MTETQAWDLLLWGVVIAVGCGVGLLIYTLSGALLS